MSNRGTIHINQPLSVIASGYKNPAHIWSRVLPMVPVDKEKDSYYEFGQEFLRYYGKIRADKSPAQRVDSYSATEKTYECKEHAYKDIVSDRETNNADPVIQPEVRVTNNLTKIVDLDIEVDVATEVFKAGNYPGMTDTPSEKWDADNADGNPIADFKSAIRKVQKEVGVKPNIAVIGAEVFDQLSIHPDLLEFYKYTGVPVLTEQMLAKPLGVDEVIVGESILITSKAGQSTVTTDYIWGKDCALIYRPSVPAIEEPSWGYTFLHKLFGGLTARVKKWREEGLGGDYVEVARSYNVKVTAQKAGYLWKTVVS